MRKFTLLLVLVICQYIVYSQIVGSNVYLQGNKTEVGISTCGSFGTATPPAVPAGYHNNVAGRGLGFVADAGRNGWTTAGPGTLPNYCGDYFLPGSPVEGFGLQIGTTNYRNFNNSGICDFNNMPGTILCYQSTPQRKSATWRSTAAVGGAIRVAATTYVPDTALFFVTQVQLCNESAIVQRNVYYLRHLDPDNDQPWAGGSFTTDNTVVSQGSDTTPALVTARSLLGCYLGLGTESKNARVSLGGFAPPTLCTDVWNGTAPYRTGIGTNSRADEAISLCFKFDSIMPGQCVCFGYAHVLNNSDLSRALALTSQAISFFSDTSDITDSLKINLCYGDTTKVKAFTNCASTYSWSWTADPPGSIIGSTTFDSIRIAPLVNTVYTALGTGTCGVDTYRVVVTVDTTVKNARITPIDSTICLGASSTITAIGGSTYSWSPGGATTSTIVVSPLATTTYTVTISSAFRCRRILSTRVLVDTIRADAGIGDSLCPGRNTIIGGTPTTTGIGFPTTWTAIPAIASTYLSSTTASNPTVNIPSIITAGPIRYIVTTTRYGCTARDTATIEVLSAPPIDFTGLDSIYCTTSSSDLLTGLPAGGIFSGVGIIGSSFSPPAAGLGGPKQINYTYTFPNGCIGRDSAYTYVDSLPKARFTGLASRYCVYDSSAVLTGFPAGGIFTGTGIVGNRFHPSIAGPGSFSITYTYTNPVSLCVDDTVINTVVNSRPIVDILGLDTIYCEYESPDTLVGSPAGGIFSGPGMTGNVFNPATAGIGIKQIVYTYTSPLTGCVNTDTAFTNVSARPVTGIAGASLNYCIYDPADSLIGTPAGGTFSGPGISGNMFNPATAGIGGPYTIIYYYFNPVSGCNSADTQLVFVHPRPIVSFSGLATQYCSYDSAVTLTGSPLGGVFSGLGIVPTNRFSPSAAGVSPSISIFYTYTDTNGCVNFDTSTTAVNARPVVTFSGLDTQYCFYTASATLVGSPAGGTFSGPGISGSTFNPTVAGIGTYFIKYTYTNPITGCTNIDSQRVIINGRPTVSYTGLSSIYCINSSNATLTGVPAGGSFVGTGMSGNIFSPSAAGIGGPYMIIYNYSSPSTGCANSDTQYVTVNPLPDPSFSGLANQYCFYSPNVNLVGSPAGGSFSGVGISGTTFSPSTAGVGGPYSIIYTYTDATTGCIGMDTQFVTITGRPAISISGLAPKYCINSAPATITATPTGGWFTGVGLFGNTFSPSAAGIGGPYDIVYYVIDSTTGCFSKDSLTTSVYALPIANFTGLNTAYCINAPIANLTGIPAGGTFTGTGITGSTFNPASAGVGGPYSITYSVTDTNGCSDDTFRNTLVNPLPVANAGLDDTICYGSTTSLTATGGSSYLWSPGGGTTSSIFVAPLVTTTYTVTVTDINNCSATDNVKITVKVITSNISRTNVTCYRFKNGTATVTPTNGLPPYTYVWSDSRGQTTSVADSLDIGTYTVTITDGEGCTGINSITITEPTLFSVSVNSTNVLCGGDSTGTVNIIPSGGTPPYSYSFTKDGLRIFTSNIVNTLTTGTYNGTASDANGCTVFYSFTLTEPVPLSIQYTIMQPRCYGYSDGNIFILATGATPPYTFTMDGQSNMSGWFINLAAGQYELQVADNNNCVYKYSIPIMQPDPVVVDINPDTLILELGEAGQFFTSYTGAPADSVSFEWSTPDGLNCTDCPNPTVSPYVDKVYTVKVYDRSDLSNPYPCVGEAIGYVFVLDGQPIYIPNAFTPNGDGENDKFYVYGKDLKQVHMQVYDRWGELLFETFRQDYGWDGSFKGIILNPGVYIYKVDAEYLNGKKIAQSGSVTLIK